MTHLKTVNMMHASWEGVLMLLLRKGWSIIRGGDPIVACRVTWRQDGSSIATYLFIELADDYIEVEGISWCVEQEDLRLHCSLGARICQDEQMEELEHLLTQIPIPALGTQKRSSSLLRPKLSPSTGEEMEAGWYPHPCPEAFKARWKDDHVLDLPLLLVALSC